MARALQTISSALLALVLVVATAWQGASIASAGRSTPVSKPICKCCHFDPARCATPACCARPADSRAPTAPAVPRCASGTEWHAIAPALLTLATLPRPNVDTLPHRPHPLEAGTVPIFQRDCSFLI